VTGGEGMVRATGDHRAMPAWLVRQDEWWPADHEVVKAHPEWFDLPKRQQRAKPAEPAPVEQATNAPGEKRTTRRG
jgi:hypothetical protein